MKNWLRWGRWALAVQVVSLSGYLLARPHLWLRQTGVIATFDGRPTSQVAVYRALDGQRLLLWISGEPWGAAAYVVYPSQGYVFEGHGGSILNGGDYWAGTLFAVNRPDAYLGRYLRGTLLRWPNEKLGLNPRVVLHPGSVEFTEGTDWKAAGSGRRVRVQLSGGKLDHPLRTHRPGRARPDEPHPLRNPQRHGAVKNP